MKPTSIQAYREHIRSGAALSQQDRLFRYIDTHPGLTRLELADRTGISITSVCGRVNALLQAEIVAEGPPRRQGTGKAAAPLYVIETVPEQVGLAL